MRVYEQEIGGDTGADHDISKILLERSEVSFCRYGFFEA